VTTVRQRLQACFEFVPHVQPGYDVIKMEEHGDTVTIEIELLGSGPTFALLERVSNILETKLIDISFDHSEYGTDVTPMSSDYVTLRCMKATRRLDDVL